VLHSRSVRLCNTASDINDNWDDDEDEPPVDTKTTPRPTSQRSQAQTPAVPPTPVPTISIPASRPGTAASITNVQPTIMEPIPTPKGDVTVDLSALGAPTDDDYAQKTSAEQLVLSVKRFFYWTLVVESVLCFFAWISYFANTTLPTAHFIWINLPHWFRIALAVFIYYKISGISSFSDILLVLNKSTAQHRALFGDRLFGLSVLGFVLFTACAVIMDFVLIWLRVVPSGWCAAYVVGNVCTFMAVFWVQSFFFFVASAWLFVWLPTLPWGIHPAIWVRMKAHARALAPFEFLRAKPASSSAAPAATTSTTSNPTAVATSTVIPSVTVSTTSSTAPTQARPSSIAIPPQRGALTYPAASQSYDTPMQQRSVYSAATYDQHAIRGTPSSAVYTSHY